MPFTAPASPASFSAPIFRPAARISAKFTKVRAKAREMGAAYVFFGKIAHFEYLAKLEKGEVKMSKSQRRDLESGKLAEQTLEAAQEVWLADKNLTPLDILRMAKADRLLGKLVASASAALTCLMGVGTAIAAGTFASPISIGMAAATVFFMAFLFPWKAEDGKVGKTQGAIAQANARAQQD